MKDIFAQNQIIIDDKQEEQFHKYYELLIEWNEKINLTAITEYEEVLWKHFIDSALLVRCELFNKKEKASVLDLGTGAGFPGIVLAILCPQYTFTLIDSLRKRIDFLEIVVRELELKNVDTFHGRAEDYGREKKFRNQFDFVVSRAVAKLPILLEYCIPFVKKNGYFVSYKGKKYEEEIFLSKKAFSKLDCNLNCVEQFLLSEKEERRYLLFINNLQLTDDKYPRKAGKPKKQPL